MFPSMPGKRLLLHFLLRACLGVKARRGSGLGAAALEEFHAHGFISWIWIHYVGSKAPETPFYSVTEWDNLILE